MYMTHKKIVSNKAIHTLPEEYQEQIRKEFEPNDEWIYDGQFFTLIEEISTGRRRWYASFRQRGKTPRPSLTIEVPTTTEPPQIKQPTRVGNLRQWHGRGTLYEHATRGRNINIAAKTKKDAAVLLVQAYGLEYTDKIFRKMWAVIHETFMESWNTEMEGITPDQPGVWLTGGENRPEKII